MSENTVDNVAVSEASAVEKAPVDDVSTGKTSVDEVPAEKPTVEAENPTVEAEKPTVEAEKTTVEDVPSEKAPVEEASGEKSPEDK